MTPPSAPDNTGELITRLKPVWLNVYWIQNALELCEGLWQHAGDIPRKYHHFFGLVHDFTIRSAILDLCKLFDRSSRRHAKDTIPDLMNYAKGHITDAYASRLEVGVLIDLGIGKKAADEIIRKLAARSDRAQQLHSLFSAIEARIPTCQNNRTLEKLFLIRDKVVAHQERLDCARQEEVQQLPSLDDLEKLNHWSSSFCQLIACTLTNETFAPHTVSARMAALDVVVRVLRKNSIPQRVASITKNFIGNNFKPKPTRLPRSQNESGLAGPRPSSPSRVPAR